MYLVNQVCLEGCEFACSVVLATCAGSSMQLRIRMAEKAMVCYTNLWLLDLLLMLQVPGRGDSCETLPLPESQPLELQLQDLQGSALFPDSHTEDCLEHPTLIDLQEENHRQNIQKFDARAKYMRFWRSLTTAARKTPPEVLAKYEEFQKDKENMRGQLTVLFEDFSQSGEDWKRSTIMQNTVLSKTRMKRGRLAWLTKKQLINKYNDEPLANMICEKKEAEGSTRPHPECPEVKQYLCLDAEEFEEEEKEVQNSSLRVQTELSRADLVALAGNGFELFRGNYLQDFPQQHAGASPAGSDRGRPSAAGTKGIESCSRSASPERSSSEKKKQENNIKSAKKQRKSTPAKAPKKKQKRARSSSSSAGRSSSNSSSASSKKKQKKRAKTSSDSEPRTSGRKKTKKRATCDSSDSEPPSRKSRGNKAKEKKRKPEKKPKEPSPHVLAKKVLTQVRKLMTECKGLKTKVAESNASQRLKMGYNKELDSHLGELESLEREIEDVIDSSSTDSEAYTNLKERIGTEVAKYRTTALMAKRMAK